MAEQDNVAVVALLVSLIALVVSLGQLLQTVFGTAEGYRRTNQQTMSIFAQTRDRRFYWSELRYETMFSTPHFKFFSGGDESLMLPAQPQKLWSLRNVDFMLETKSESRLGKSVLLVGWNDDEHKDADRVKHLNQLIRSSKPISKLQRFQSMIDRWLGRSLTEIVPARSRPYAATWLILLESLYEDAVGFKQQDKDTSYIYERKPSSIFDAKAKLGPDKKQIRYPAIECHPRSWDLLPPDVVRPVASISLGNLLTLCYRLGISVQDFSQKGFSADGNGHHFGALSMQALGMLVEYRHSQLHDPEFKFQAKDKFIPSENADKLAFGIIPPHTRLGLVQDWPIIINQKSRDIPEAMRRHFQNIGVSESALDLVTEGNSPRQNNVCRTFGETVLLLAPFMALDGLGVVKYVPPLPWDWQDGSILGCREGRLVLWHHMQARYAGSEEVSTNCVPPRRAPENERKFSDTQEFSPFKSQRQWVYEVLNFLIRKYPMIFKRWAVQVGMFEKNAHNSKKHIFLGELRSAFNEADTFLKVTFCPGSGPTEITVEDDDAVVRDFAIPGKTSTYIHLVAVHLEMAIKVQADVYRRRQKARDDGTEKDFRKGPAVPHTLPKLTEMMHCYIDAVEGDTLVELYRDKTQDLEQAPDLDDDQIRDGWYTMMLRAILWALAHHPVKDDNLPYPSRYWNDNTLVFIA